MRIGQIRDGQLATLGMAVVAVMRKVLRPIPDAIAELGREPELLVETDFGDPMDVAQRFGALEVGRMIEPPLERREDLRLRQAKRTRSAHGKDERKAEARLVVGVEPGDAGELVGRALRKPCPTLLVGRLAG